MPDYDIYVLDEGSLTFANGGQLDGVTQGDGSHLVGETITLTNNGFRSISITDTTNSDFSDNDTGQRLNGAQTIDGQSYADGTVVEAEYSFVVTLANPPDPANPPTWTLIAFNVRDSSPSYATVEGIAVIGGPGDFPPANVPLTVTSAAEGPSFPAAGYVTPICFADGTEILTDRGSRPVEELSVGDRVQTRSDGFQSIRWISSRRFAAVGDLAPICFRTGVLGNSQPLRLSPQHRLLVTDWRAELYLGAPEVLVAAKAFVNGQDVVVERGGTVTYHHFLFDHHQIVFANGVPCESFHPGIGGIDTLSRSARDELFRIFPELKEQPMAYGPSVYPALKSHEAQAMLAA